MKHLVPALLAALCCATAASPAARAAAPDESVERVIVRWKAGTAPSHSLPLREVEERLGRRVRPLGAITPRMEVLRLEGSAGERRDALQALRRHPAVEFAVEDRRVRAHAVVPNDPLFPQQWYLGTAQPAATRAVLAWETTLAGTPEASDVVIAVIDTGVRFEHPDLRRLAEGGKLLPGYDFVSGDKPGVFATANDGDGWDDDPSDPGDYLTAEDLQDDLFKGKQCGGGSDNEQPTGSSWHGTRVSGLIAAGANNGEGITGTAFHARVLPVRALGKCGGYDSDVLAAMYWAAGLAVPTPLLSGTPPPNPYPARVLNLSLGSPGECTDAYRQAVRDITAAGVLIVASAGNEGGPVDSPANCPGVLGVAGVRHAGTKVGYSNLGMEVGIAAPAGNCVNLVGTCLYSLLTTTNSGARGPEASAYTSPVSGNVGTSFASPLVSAGAGLMLAVNPRLTPPKLIERLKASARPFPSTSDTVPLPPVCRVPASSSDVQDAECLCTTQSCGAGLLDIAGAVDLARRPVALVSVSGLTGAGRTLTLDGSASAAAQGRTLASHAWSVVSATDGASADATFSAPTSPVTSIPSPARGTLVVRLTVTDGNGDWDWADVTINAPTSGGVVDSPSSPPTPAPPQPATGGGGRGDGWLLAGLLCGLLARIVTWRHMRAIVQRA